TSLHAHLAGWVSAGQAAGEVRTDLPPERLAGWLVLLLDGYTGQVATPRASTPTRSAPCCSSRWRRCSTDPVARLGAMTDARALALDRLRADGASGPAVATFALQYDRLAAGATGLIHEADVAPA